MAAPRSRGPRRPRSDAIMQGTCGALQGAAHNFAKRALVHYWIFFGTVGARGRVQTITARAAAIGCGPSACSKRWRGGLGAEHINVLRNDGVHWGGFKSVWCLYAAACCALKRAERGCGEKQLLRRHHQRNGKMQYTSHSTVDMCTQVMRVVARTQESHRKRASRTLLVKKR